MQTRYGVARMRSERTSRLCVSLSQRLTYTPPHPPPLYAFRLTNHPSTSLYHHTFPSSYTHKTSTKATRSIGVIQKLGYGHTQGEKTRILGGVCSTRASNCSGEGRFCHFEFGVRSRGCIKFDFPEFRHSYKAMLSCHIFCFVTLFLWFWEYGEARGYNVVEGENWS